MNVTVSTLRAELWPGSSAPATAREVIVTDRGTPVARLLAVDTAPLIDELTRNNVLSPPRSADRPVARGAIRVRAAGPVADLVSDQRR